MPQTQTSAREDLRRLISDLAVVRGKVTLASGREADYYVDLRRISLHAAAAPLVGQVLLEGERVEAKVERLPLVACRYTEVELQLRRLEVAEERGLDATHRADWAAPTATLMKSRQIRCQMASSQ